MGEASEAAGTLNTGIGLGAAIDYVTSLGLMDWRCEQMLLMRYALITGAGA